MKRIILYGAGGIGKKYYDFLQYRGLSQEVECFCDKNAEQIKKVADKVVLTYEKAKKLDLNFVISAEGKAHEEIKKNLTEDGIPYFSSLEKWYISSGEKDLVDWNREFCAYRHVNGMDSYFNEAEEEDALAIFWNEKSPFFRMFEKLDLENVIELACGRGRHVEKYKKYAGHITLVDILEKNITYCKKRFSDCSNISYYCNNGFDLKELPDNTYTSLFTYDAMVHFEMIDIYNYLKDIYRILKPGAQALFHHSNNTSDYRISFQNSVFGRSYMSKEIFAYMAYRVGYDIVFQQLIDWGEEDLDCLTLLQKPESAFSRE